MVLVVVGVVAVALVATVHWYLWRRLVADVSRPGGWYRRVGTVLAVVLGLLVPATLIGTRVLSPAGAGRVLAWPGYLWIALLLYLTIAVAVLEVPRALVRRWLCRPAPATGNGGTEPNPAAHTGPAAETGPGREAGATADPATAPDTGAAGTAAATNAEAPADRPTGTPIDPARRLFLARSLALVAGAAAAGTVGYGLATELRGPVVKRVTVPLARLSPEMDGFRVAVVSDMHLGPILQRGFTERVVAEINRQSPDLITIVGDLVDGSVADLGPAVQPLRHLSAPHGAYFVTGNHEYFSGVTQWVDEVRSLGVHPLRNEHQDILGGQSSALTLAGVNDATGASVSAREAPNYDAALRGRDPANPVLLLAHQPIQVHEAAKRGVDLQLSGHTHGGQMWPVQYAARAQQGYLSGLARVDRTWLYVTNGAGAWGPPVRVGATPDITVVTLRATTSA
ncbi:metallophosphoesterase [Actinocatenispora rupis]|uniref:Membrane protein n=1 Tax=Actinocatenispora rupis TaxID=519421 RepID=A0A8J3NF38_9ACTN|nr:metallophosphoesterase [Actinocatenispora rupis]GID13319.1 membrane protein [Actinocatenispora rupis]